MTLKDRRRSLFWTLQAGGWLVFGVAVSLGRIGELSLSRIVVFDWTLALFGFLTTIGLIPIYSRLRIRGARPIRVLGIILICSYVAAALWTVAYDLYVAYAAGPFLSLLAGRPVPFTSRVDLLDDVVYNTVVMLAWSMLYVGAEYYRAMQEERERALRAESEAHQAQLRALRYQINPHFLFNTMNAISTLVGEGRNREARSMIARLSDFLRLTLDEETAPDVPLAHEIEFVRRYLDIEQVRFGDRLTVRIDVADEVLSTAVPALILQPLVENAIKHAIAPREEGGCITVEARRSGDDVLLSVKDDGPGPAAAVSAGHGIGLANVRDRLRAVYGDDHGFSVEAPDEGGLEAIIRIPYRTSARWTGSTLQALEK